MRLPEEFEITCQELSNKIDNKEDFCLIDVREPHEVVISKIACSIQIPLAELPAKITELPKNKEIIIHCRSGMRSANAVMLLAQAGFSTVKNLVGGINRWVTEIDTSQPVY